MHISQIGYFAAGTMPLENPNALFVGFEIIICVFKFFLIRSF